MPADAHRDALIKELLESGVAPKYILRITSELEDHCLDLEAEAQRSGIPAEEAAGDARQRLGDISAIAQEFSKHPELRSWVYTSSWVEPLLRAAAATCLALGMPIRAIVASNDVLIRFAAAAVAGAAMTLGMLLAMYMAVSSGPEASWMLSRTPFVPADELSDPKIESQSSMSLSPLADADRADNLHGPGASPAGTDAGFGDDGRQRQARQPFGSTRPMTAPGDAVLDLPARIHVAALEPTRGWALPAMVTSSEPTIGPTLGLRFGVADRELRPVAKAVEPGYPWAAARRGLEGYVVVEYTVTRAGTVSEIVVVESSNDVFNRAAVEAANGFKYMPRIIAGSPVDVRGVRTTIRFLLEA